MASPEAAATPAITFKDLAISEKVLAVLTKHAFVTPTPIQSSVIPHGIAGKDIIGIAQTGTGKTLGFSIPMIERIIADRAAGKDSRGLVMLPTRELALQVDETVRKLGMTAGMNLNVRSAVLIGGDSMGRQVRELRAGPDIVIATPGRLIDHLKQGNITLDRVAVLVLDEADHMFDIGFAPQIREIMKKVPKERQTLLFSATMPNEIAKLAMEHMKLPLRIEVAPQGTSAASVDQEIIIVERKSKFNLLVKLLGEYAGQPVLVFTRTKHGAKDIAHDLRNIGTTAAEIHSNRSLGQRREALDGFKKHKYQVLVATDIAARGIDVKDISLVVNYDLPEQSEDYVHRIGRTGRAGKTGKAVSFAAPDQKRDIMDIERLIKKPLKVKSHEGAAMSSYSAPKPFYGGRRGGGSRGGYVGAARSGGYRSGGAGASRGGSSYGGARSGGSSYSGSRTGSSSYGSSHSARPARAAYGSTSTPGASAPARAPRPAYGAGASRTGGSSYGASTGPRRTGGFASKYPRPLKTDPSKKGELGTGYRRVFRKGVR